MKTLILSLIILSGCMLQKSDCSPSPYKTISSLTFSGLEIKCIQPYKYPSDSLEYYKCINDAVKEKLK